MDLKNGASESLAEILQPARKYFERNPSRFDEMRRVLA
jgi:hypothetical protein